MNAEILPNIDGNPGQPKIIKVADQKIGWENDERNSKTRNSRPAALKIHCEPEDDVYLVKKTFLELSKLSLVAS